MLSSYRVVDLTDHRGHLAGFILASLGAEVIVVERAGDVSRHRAPVAHATGESLERWAMRRGTKSVVVESDDDLWRLIQSADVVIESPDPGRGLDRQRVADANPAAVHVTISAFGSTGPKAQWAASDLTIGAAACTLAVTGDSDRAPLRTTTPQAWLHAGGEAASGAMVALRERQRSGLGQHVDVSAQQATIQASFPGIIAGPNEGPMSGRTAGGILVAGFHLQFVYPSRDGFVSITLLFGETIGRFTARLMQWVYEEGCCDEDLRDLDWLGFGVRLFADPTAPGQLESAKEAVSRLTSSRPKQELFEEAQRRQVLLAPVATPAELTALDHFAERDYFDTVHDPELGAVVAPGRFARSSRSALPRLGPPPRRGEHTAAVLAEPRAPDVGPAAAAARQLPLAGLKVVDTTWVYAGPFTTRLLADYGATVIKVEGPERFDASRGGGGGLKGDLGPDASIQFGTLNAGKLGVALDLNTEVGQEVMRDLACWADVVAESYTPGTMAAWGLGYEELARRNPELVMLSTSLMGATGPLSTYAGFGNLAGAITGFYELTGWPDRSPAGPYLAYTDYLVPRFMVPLVLAALDERDRSGTGQHLDFAQAEAAIHHLSASVLEFTVNGEHPSRLGNADPVFVPHSVYPAAEDDRWVAVVCETDDQWRRLAPVVGLDAEMGLTERRAAEGEIDAAISEWTRRRTCEEAEERLQRVGVPAHRVQNSDGCMTDPQLVHRGQFVTVAHPTHDQMVVEGPRFQLSETPAVVTRSGPALGEHNDDVLRGVLGYDDDRIAQIAIGGGLG